MKKFIFSLVALVTMSTFTMAEGYIGAGYSYMESNEEWGFLNGEATANGMTFITGAEANDYLGVEVRYSTSVGDIDYKVNGVKLDDDRGDFSNIAIYLKPMYKIDTFKLYALVGYGMVTYDDGYSDESENAFQWGLGGSFSVNENVDIFVDYAVLYDDNGGFETPSDYNIDIDKFTFGVIYNF